jgi:hypothetical protein
MGSCKFDEGDSAGYATEKNHVKEILSIIPAVAAVINVDAANAAASSVLGRAPFVA